MCNGNCNCANKSCDPIKLMAFQKNKVENKPAAVSFEIPVTVRNFAPDKALSIQVGSQLIRVWESYDKYVYVEVNGRIIKLGE